MASQPQQQHQHHHQPPSQQRKKKKPKGHSPAHQNATAWKHNPKSKKTAKILSSPISSVCRRCHQKLEWRKQYRKYKPRTVVGSCNLCNQKNVFAAYHTICGPCSSSHEKVLPLLQELNGCHRICCVCVKAPVLEGLSGEDNQSKDDASSANVAADGRPLRLRQLKTLERKKQQLQHQAHKRSGQSLDDSEQLEEQEEASVDEDSTVDEEHVDEEHVDDDERDIDLQHNTSPPPLSEGEDEEDEDHDDPFLQAVGGKDNLLVGEAYQQKLLEQDVQRKLTLQEQQQR